MKLEIVKYECAICANIFEAPEISSDSYGEFLLRSSSGTVMYLNALQDKTYEEVDQLLATYEKISNLSASDRAQVLRRIYGEIACDSDNNGNPLTLGACPVCPVCGSQKMASWEFKEPPVLINIDIEPVRHNRWSNLSKNERLILIKESLPAKLHSSK